MEEILPDPRVRLPAGRQFALTWSIPDHYGGMTSALFHRSRAFVRLGGEPVQILTFDSRPDYPAIAARLRASGELVAGMQLINLWDWLRQDAGFGTALRSAAHPARARDIELRHFSPLAVRDGTLSRFRGDAELSRTRFAPDGVTVLQVDHYREDGSLLASDRRDCEQAGQPTGRSVVICDRAGEPVRSWPSVWGLYRYWLDELCAGEPSFMIVDSKTVANFMLTYRRTGAVTMHVVHGSHVGGAGTQELRPSRRTVFERLDDFDAVVFLTSRQRADAQSLAVPDANLCVIPNSRDTTPAPTMARPPGRGTVVASLTGRKRVEHAARAALDAAERTEGLVTLDVFGEGERRVALERWIDGLGASDTIRLHGYDRAASRRLGEASFVIISSTTEGFPLVLIEAMAAGCIPIAYDVPYGPGDLIEHGRNGFLVEPGDVPGLTRAILELQAMPARRVIRLRRNARRSAAAFSDLAVTRMWAKQMRRAQSRKSGHRHSWHLAG